MAFIEWSGEFELGIGTIDRQHRWLVEATNALSDEVAAGSHGPAGTARLLTQLHEYAVEHFVTEELLFQRYGYALAEAHHKEHCHFVAAVEDWERRLGAGENLGGEVLEFLKHWLVYHILKSDRAYVPFLKAQGVL